MKVVVVVVILLQIEAAKLKEIIMESPTRLSQSQRFFRFGRLRYSTHKYKSRNNKRGFEQKEAESACGICFHFFCVLIFPRDGDGNLMQLVRND